MNWLETKYINLISSRLTRFKKVHSNFNFRCPVCNDSQKDKRKTRAWILDSTKGVRFYCHNCGASLSFENFLKRIDVNLYYDFVKDRFAEREELTPTPVKEESKFDFVRPKFSIKLKKISQLDPNHPAKLYVQNRKIPSSLHYKLYYAPKFKKWAHSLAPDKFENLDNDEPRLIFPLLDEEKNFFGFQGRSFNPKHPAKYITILLDDRKPKLFGLDTVDFTKTVYVIEGPIDSLFIPNCLASCGGRLDTNVGTDTVLVYDNEPRSKETIHKLEAGISAGYNVFIWPDEYTCKDINDLVMENGFTPNQIKDIFDKHTYCGLSATLRLTEWKKI